MMHKDFARRLYSLTIREVGLMIVTVRRIYAQHFLSLTEQSKDLLKRSSATASFS